MVKNFIYGLVLGLTIALASTAYSSDSASTVLFPSQFVFNGQTETLDPEYQVLNYEGHAYVPIRFVAENMGASVGYDDTGSLPTISINYFPANMAIYTDPHYASNVHVGNIQVSPLGDQFVVSGLATIDPIDNTMRPHKLAFSLHFLNDNGEEMGSAVTGYFDITEGEIRYFKAKTNDNLTGFSEIRLRIEMLDHSRLPDPKPPWN